MENAIAILITALIVAVFFELIDFLIKKRKR